MQEDDDRKKLKIIVNERKTIIMFHLFLWMLKLLTPNGLFESLYVCCRVTVGASVYQPGAILAPNT